MIPARALSADRHWYIVGRWQEFEGESRVNFLRVAAIGTFYAIQLAQHHWLESPVAEDIRFHKAATLLAALGIFAALGVHLSLRRQFFPAYLKFLSTTADLTLVTAGCLLGSAAHSPFRVAYFVVIALAALRFNLPLIWWTTLGSLAGYLTLVGATDRTWFDPQHAVRPIEQLMMLASLTLCGIVLGQIVRRVRILAAQFADRTANATPGGTRS